MIKIPLFYALSSGFILFASFSLLAQEANKSRSDFENIVALTNEWMQTLERKDKNRLERIIHSRNGRWRAVNSQTTLAAREVTARN